MLISKFQQVWSLQLSGALRTTRLRNSVEICYVPHHVYVNSGKGRMLLYLNHLLKSVLTDNS